MPIIIKQTRRYAQPSHALYPGLHLHHVVNRPGSKTKLIDKLTTAALDANLCRR
jgi:hypothetical protein